jgi:CDP-glycerol glycerophosphotransferase (TagB/SpsB family)
LYFFVYDIDEYAREQGLNIDPLAEMPGASARDATTLADKVRAGISDGEAQRKFRERYVSCATGDCTTRIADLIIDHLAIVKEPK